MKPVKRLLFGAVAAVLCLSAIELGADVVRYVREKAQVAGRSRAPASIFDDYVRYRLAPSQTTEIQDRPVTINSLGLRGPEPRERRWRVLCLGESVTFGWHASGDSGTYPAYLASELDELDVDVINAGQPRWNAMDQFDIYVTDLQRLQPDVIVWMAGWNDMCYQLTQPIDLREPAPRPSSVFSIAYLTRLMLMGLRKPSDEEAVRGGDEAPDRFRWEYLPMYERVLRSLVRLARVNGSVPVLVTLPHFMKEQLSEDEKQQMLSYRLSWPHISYDGWLTAVTRVNAIIRDVARDLDVPLVEAADAIPSRHFTDLCHLDDAGNELLARQIAPVVERVLQSR